MALVQRLTGPGSTSQAQFDVAAAGAGPSSDAPPQPASAMEYEPREFLLSPTAALSPAARLAAIERSVRPLPPHAPVPPYYGGAAGDDFFLPASASADLDGFAAALGGAPAGFRPGILSPAALPPAASTGLFSPMPLDPSCLSWLSELSPFLPSAGTRAEQATPFAPSPRSSLLLATPTMPSPATFSVLEFFSSNFPDL
ncbi:protein MKS1-like [Panicum miliaceum]|uniref:Protein MKS1-like n=1 Tax=Panicum miliaceum TaxID=4540 RepID=A0A3L6QHS6_PANMI|nr:protein MKS1-like [Panicum miliaceum]